MVRYTKRRSIRFTKKKPARKRRKRPRPSYSHKKPTVKSLNKAVSKLFARIDKKFMFTKVDNVLVAGAPALNQEFNAYLLNQIPSSTNPAAGLLPWNRREDDSAECNLRNIRIHMTAHVSPSDINVAPRTKKVYIALIKTTNGVGSTAGITPPKVGDIFDPASYPGPGGLLAQWECYRLANGLGSSNLDTTTILKYWSFYLAPQGGPTKINERTTGGPLPTATITGSSANGNMNYTQDRKSNKTIMYTHNCMNAKLQFADATTVTPLNVKYYLIALAQGTDVTVGWYLNAVIKTNFVDS